jgi:hypoxanthine-guanine phosphoribosyltransferase
MSNDAPAPFPIMIEEDRVRARIAEMAESLQSGEEPLLVAVLLGARPFADALCAELGRDEGDYETVRLSSYGQGTVSSGQIEVVQDLECSVVGRRIAGARRHR